MGRGLIGGGGGGGGLEGREIAMERYCRSCAGTSKSWTKGMGWEALIECIVGGVRHGCTCAEEKVGGKSGRDLDSKN